MSNVRLFEMDFDGRNIQRLTNHRSVVISPAISKDKTKVLYSLVESKKNIRNEFRLILFCSFSSRRGLNPNKVKEVGSSRI